MFVGAVWVFGCDGACQANCSSKVFNVAYGTIVSLLFYMAFVALLWIYFWNVFRGRHAQLQAQPEEGLTRAEINAAIEEAERREAGPILVEDSDEDDAMAARGDAGSADNEGEASAQVRSHGLGQVLVMRDGEHGSRGDRDYASGNVPLDGPAVLVRAEAEEDSLA